MDTGAGGVISHDVDGNGNHLTSGVSCCLSSYTRSGSSWSGRAGGVTVDDRRMVSRAFHASKFTEALRYREQVQGVMVRFVHPTMGVMYEVRLVPRWEAQYKSFDEQ